MSITRRDLLRGRLAGWEAIIRPPWSVAESDFVERCTRCRACIDACPEGIVVRSTGGFPAIDFQRGACTFCGRCAEACGPKALDRARTTLPWSLHARIAPSCLAFNRITCRACGDACQETAILFEPKPGGVAVPGVDNGRCTGCGACAGICPANAVALTEHETTCEECD